MLWQCKSCGRQTSLGSGTVLHRTRLPLTVWFWATYPVTTHPPGLSAVQLQRQLEISYETAWALLHKLRQAMVRPDREARRRPDTAT
jgi:transposase-like protein